MTVIGHHSGNLLAAQHCYELVGPVNFGFLECSNGIMYGVLLGSEDASSVMYLD